MCTVSFKDKVKIDRFWCSWCLHWTSTEKSQLACRKLYTCYRFTKSSTGHSRGKKTKNLVMNIYYIYLDASCTWRKTLNTQTIFCYISMRAAVIFLLLPTGDHQTTRPQIHSSISSCSCIHEVNSLLFHYSTAAISSLFQLALLLNNDILNRFHDAICAQLAMASITPRVSCKQKNRCRWVWETGHFITMTSTKDLHYS